MAYDILKHTADIRVVADGRDRAELFGSVLLGMIRIIGPERDISAGETVREIEISSADETSLLVDFLNEALFSFIKTRNFIPEESLFFRPMLR